MRRNQVSGPPFFENNRVASRVSFFPIPGLATATWVWGRHRWADEDENPGLRHHQTGGIAPGMPSVSGGVPMWRRILQHS